MRIPKTGIPKAGIPKVGQTPHWDSSRDRDSKAGNSEVRDSENRDSETRGSEVSLAHQNRTIAIASDFRVDASKSPEIPQKEGIFGSEIAAQNRKSLATFHRTLKSQCNIAFSCLGNRAISEVRDGHRNRKSQKSLRFRCAKEVRDSENGKIHGPLIQTPLRLPLTLGRN